MLTCWFLHQSKYAFVSLLMVGSESVVNNSPRAFALNKNARNIRQLCLGQIKQPFCWLTIDPGLRDKFYQRLSQRTRQPLHPICSNIGQSLHIDHGCPNIDSPSGIDRHIHASMLIGLLQLCSNAGIEPRLRWRWGNWAERAINIKNQSKWALCNNMLQLRW